MIILKINFLEVDGLMCVRALFINKPLCDVRIAPISFKRDRQQLFSLLCMSKPI